MSRTFTSVSYYRDEHLPDVCPGCVRYKCQPCSSLKSARNGLEMAVIIQICALYVADIAGAMPCTQKLSEKSVILFIYQIISQCSWQIFATACKEQSVKISTVSGNSPFLKKNIWLDNVFFSPAAHRVFGVVVWDVLCAFFCQMSRLFTHCLQLVLSGRAAAGPSP